VPDAPNNLVLRISLGGRILLKGIFGAPGASIDCIVFDHARAWTRDDLLRFAPIAPVLGAASSPDNSEGAQTPESASRAHARTISTFVDRGA
jgi:hypothetical protein